MEATRRLEHFQQAHRERIRHWENEKLFAEFAERIFEQIKGFGSYGFPESTPPASPSWPMYQLLAEMPRAGRVRLRPAQLATDGFLRPSQIVQDALSLATATARAGTWKPWPRRPRCSARRASPKTQ
jgi:hypothetical protein